MARPEVESLGSRWVPSPAGPLSLAPDPGPHQCGVWRAQQPLLASKLGLPPGLVTRIPWGDLWGVLW